MAQDAMIGVTSCKSWFFMEEEGSVEALWGVSSGGSACLDLGGIESPSLPTMNSVTSTSCYYRYALAFSMLLESSWVEVELACLLVFEELMITYLAWSLSRCSSRSKAYK